MILIADASVVVKWLVEEPDRSAARSVLARNDALQAPDFVFVEVANVLWKKVLDTAACVRTAIEAMLALRDSRVVKPVTQTEIRAWIREGHKWVRLRADVSFGYLRATVDVYKSALAYTRDET